MDEMEAVLKRVYKEVFQVDEKKFDEVWHLDGFRPIKFMGLFQKKERCGICDEKAIAYHAFGHIKHEGVPVGRMRPITVPTSHMTGVSVTSYGPLICDTPKYMKCPDGHVSARVLAFSSGDDPGNDIIVKGRVNGQEV